MPWPPRSPGITPLDFFPVGLCQEQEKLYLYLKKYRCLEGEDANIIMKVCIKICSHMFFISCQYLFLNGTKRINIVVFWVMTPRNLLGVYSRIGEPAMQVALEQLNKIKLLPWPTGGHPKENLKIA
jgi:hypothetical protein